MAEARPFVGLLYDVAVAGPLETLTSPPYDVISPQDQERFHRAGPYNVVRLILGRDHPSGTGRGDKYMRAASHLRSWRAEGALRSTPEPSVYPYELAFHLGGVRRRVRGLILEIELEPWGGSIVPHERTLAGPIEDRLRLLRTVRANLSPVHAVLPGRSGHASFSAFLDGAMAGPPALEVTDESGTRHRLWTTPGLPPELVETIRSEPLMIADGHHRYSVALAYREEMRARSGPGPWDSLMMLVVAAAAEDPPVLPIHRLLPTGPPPEASGERVVDLAEILATVRDEDLTYGTVTNEGGVVTHRVASLNGQPPTVCALHEQLLDRHVEVELRFVPDAAAAEAEVRMREGSAAFILPATTVPRVWSLVQAGQKLPQKSTYFWPKPRTGMVIRPFDP
jgi:uncharacterized protein (DUF1015 family)